MLDLSSNSLHSLNENVFRGRDLYNLQKIFMRHCNIHVIIGRCFEGISNLVELDLSYNLLEVIPKAALKDCSYLMTLSLRGNPIRRVQKESFDNLKVFILCFIFISVNYYSRIYKLWISHNVKFKQSPKHLSYISTIFTGLNLTTIF